MIELTITSGFMGRGTVDIPKVLSEQDYTELIIDEHWDEFKDTLKDNGLTKQEIEDFDYDIYDKIIDHRLIDRKRYMDYIDEDNIRYENDTICEGCTEVIVPMYLPDEFLNITIQDYISKKNSQ